MTEPAKIPTLASMKKTATRLCRILGSPRQYLPFYFYQQNPWSAGGLLPLIALLLYVSLHIVTIFDPLH